MPASESILAQLAQVANGYFHIAVAWHGLMATAALVLLTGFRPTRRTVAWVSCLPLWSVALLAWISRNPFNAVAVGVLAVVLTGLALRTPRSEIGGSPRWAAGLGVVLLDFAWVYPHFLDASRSSLAYLVGAPVGVLPCPTLALVVGIALVAGAPSGRLASMLLGSVAAFYALFGLFRLGVVIDAFLLAGAVGLLVLAARSTSPRSAFGTGVA
jgi:hypothetical protein